MYRRNMFGKLKKVVMLMRVQTLTTKDCKGPQTNMPENVGSIKTWSAKMRVPIYIVAAT